MRHIVVTLMAGAMLLGPSTVKAQFGSRGSYGYGRDRGYDSGGLIRSVEEHVRRASSGRRPNHSEYKRYDNALKHLSEFDSRLSRGQFDRGKLDHAIEDVNNIVRHNHLDRRDRDVLASDVQRLRDFRARYRY